MQGGEVRGKAPDPAEGFLALHKNNMKAYIYKDKEGKTILCVKANNMATADYVAKLDGIDTESENVKVEIWGAFGKEEA